MATETSPPMVRGSRLGIPNRHSKIDVAKALRLRLQGATLADIAEMQGVTPQAIDQALKRFQPFVQGLEPGQLSAYSEERANLFNVVEQHLTGSLLDPQALEKASLNNRAYALKVIHEARRLETGQSTSNLSVLGKLVMQAESSLGANKAQAIDKQGNDKASTTPHEGAVLDGEADR